MNLYLRLLWLILRMLREFLRRRWLPVLGAAEITFIRPLPPFARFELVTRVVTWDEKYVYLEQTFERDGRLCAHAFVKGLFLERGVKVANADVVRVIGYEGEAPPLPEVLKRWAELAATKRGNYEKPVS